MEAIILAGGFGTRLRDVIGNEIPKPLAIIDRKEFLYYLLDYLNFQGIKKVIMSLGYKANIIKDLLGNKYKGISIKYSIENEPLKTGGAIKKALKLCMSKNIFVFNADTVFYINLKKLLSFHIRKNSKVSLAVKNIEDTRRYGRVIMKKGQIVGFKEKNKIKVKGTVNGGVYILNKTLFYRFNKKVFSFETEFLKKKSNKKYALEFNGFFIDIGIKKDYELANILFPKMLKRSIYGNF